MPVLFLAEWRELYFHQQCYLNLQIIWDRTYVSLYLSKKALKNIGKYGIINNNNLLRLGLLQLRFKGFSTMKMLNHLWFAELPDKASAWGIKNQVRKSLGLITQAFLKLLRDNN